MTSRGLVVLAPLLFLPAAALAGSAGHASLKDAQGKHVGTARLTSVKGGVRVHVEATGLSPGKHGIHIHAAGRCEAPDFKSAGGHFNPGERKHGLHNPEGAHAGDLPNLVVGKNGKGKADFVAKGASLSKGTASLFGPDGTAIVIHAGADDEKTDPSGNSGDRIACGVVVKG